MRRFHLSERYFRLVLLVLGAAALALVIYTTPWGAGLSDDSYAYVKPARDFVAGNTPVLNPHYPPLLPILVTLTGLVGIEPLLGIRLLNALFFGLNVALAGILVRRMTGSRGAAIAAAVIFLLAQVMLEVHAWAMSEALFILLCFATLLAFSLDAERPRWSGLAITAVLAGLAVLARYAGIGLLGAVGLLLLLQPGVHWKKRLARGLVFGTISGGMFALYVLGYTRALSEVSGVSPFRFDRLPVDEITGGLYNILVWFMPGRIARGREFLVLGGLALAFAAAVLAYFLLEKTRARSIWKAVREQPLFPLLIVLTGANLFVLYQAHISPTYRSPFDTRLLSPNLALLIVSFTALLGLVWKESRAPVKVGLVLVFAWFVFLYAPRTAEYVSLTRARGAGFAAPYWHDLDAASFFTSHPPEKLVTTAPMGVYFALGLDIRGVYELTPDLLRAYLKERDGYLVVFESMPLEFYGYPAEAYLQGMVQVDSYSDCQIYQVAR